MDEKTLVVELIRPTPYFLELISFCVFFPVNHTLDEKDHTWAFHAGSHFTSNGFYVLKKWKHHSDITLVKNPHYWNPQVVNLDQVRFLMIDNESTVLQMYEKNELDIVIQFLSPLPIDALPKLHEQGLLHTHPMGGSTFTVFNTKTIPFCNKNMRKAFSCAMNRGKIVENITQLNEIPALGAIPPVLKLNKNRAFIQDHDEKQAKELFKLGLKELGLKAQDLNLTYVYRSAELDDKIAQALQQQWLEALGVRVNLENVEHKILLDKLIKRKYTFAQSVWYAQYSDQMNLLERYISPENVKNYAQWENPKFVSLINQSFLASSPKERLDILERAEEIFVDDLPLTCIYHKNAITLLKPYITDVQYTPIGNLCFERLCLKPKNIR